MQRRLRSDSQLALERNLRDREHREAEARRVRAIGTLAAGVAHHLNGLLTSLLTNAELLRARIVPGGDDHALAEEITHAAQRAAEVARHLLVYVGRAHQASKAVDVGALARDVIAGLAPTLSPEAKLTLEIADSVPPVMGDRAQLAEALTQLIRNAVEALPGGSGAVTVRVADGPAHVELEVADAGAGMTRDVRGRMFEPFFSTKAVGRGLGLATAMGIVQAHGGSVAVTSAPGRGTTVRVLLPSGDERSPSTG